MAAGVTDLLNQGICCLAGGGTVEGYMRQTDLSDLSRNEQEELLQLLGTARHLFYLGQAPIPAPRAKAANRARFLGLAVQEKERTRRSAAGWLPASLRRGLVALLLSLVLVFALGTGAVTTAADSLPGSVLYPLKLATEDVRLGLTPSVPARAQLYMRFADERIEEMVRLANAQKPVAETVVERMAQQWQGALQAAASISGDSAHELLQAIVETSSAQHQTLLQISSEASPEVQQVLQAGAAIAADTALQAQDMLQQPPLPETTPTPSGTLPPTVLPTWPPAVGPALTATSTTMTLPTLTVSQPSPVTPARQQTPVVAPTGSSTPSATSSPLVPVVPSATRTRWPTGTPVATRTARATATPTASALPTETPSPTAPPPTVTPTDTAEPTSTPMAVFHVTNTAHANQVPATHRIHYVICVVNDGDVPLTSVVLVARWSPRECVYLLPNNPPDQTWVIGTVAPRTRQCVFLDLNTYSTCGGRTVVTSAEVTCDQGTASAVEFTRLGPTPGPTASPSATPTPSTTATVQSTQTGTAAPTATCTETPTPSPTLGTPPLGATVTP